MMDLLAMVGQKNTWEKQELKEMVQKYLANAEQLFPKKPQDIRVGDVTTVYLHKIPHPAVVFKVQSEQAYCIMMSHSGDKPYVVAPVEGSRFWNGFYTTTVVNVPIEEAIKGWLGVYEHPKKLGKVAKMVQKKLKVFFDTKPVFHEA